MRAANTGDNEYSLALIFPPAMHPTSPPLGIAALKAYLELEGCIHSVRVHDLNLAYTKQALSWIEKGRLRMKLAGMGVSQAAEKIRQVSRYFQGKDGLAEFLDLDKYNECADFYHRFQMVLNGLFDDSARKILAGLPVPPLIEGFFRELLGPVVATSPRLVGFSILFSQQLTFAAAMAKLLKETGVRVVFGGATLSVMPSPEGLLEKPIALQVGKERWEVELGKYVDYLIVGEGEAGLAALVEHVVDGDLSNVPGLVYSDNRQVRKNPPQMISELDQLPLPNFGDFDLGAYHSPLSILPYLSSRGCFWGRCAFCTHQKTYLAYREESVEKTVKQLATLKERYGVSHFNLVDEMIHPYRFARLRKRMVQERLDIFWSAYAKPTGSFSEVLLEDLHDAGLRVVMWGVESGSQRVLDAMKKGVRLEDAGRVLTSAHCAGIWNLIFLLFGFPSETAAEWDATLSFLEDHRESIDALSKSRFVLVAGSEVMHDPHHYGISEVLDRPRRDPISIAYDYRVSTGLTQEEVQERFERQIPLLDRCGRSPHFGVFRDHLLLHASAASPKDLHD